MVNKGVYKLKKLVLMFLFLVIPLIGICETPTYDDNSKTSFQDDASNILNISNNSITSTGPASTSKKINEHFIIDEKDNTPSHESLLINWKSVKVIDVPSPAHALYVQIATINVDTGQDTYKQILFLRVEGKPIVIYRFLRVASTSANGTLIDDKSINTQDIHVAEPYGKMWLLGALLFSRVQQVYMTHALEDFDVQAGLLEPLLQERFNTYLHTTKKK